MLENDEQRGGTAEGCNDEQVSQSDELEPQSGEGTALSSDDLSLITEAHQQSAASLDSVAAGLAQELKTINEEMNKIREELYGDQGIGGITKELAKFKAFGDLLSKTAQECNSNVSEGASASSSSTFDGSEARHRARPNIPRDREAEIEEVQRRILERRRARERELSNDKNNSFTLPEMLVLVLLIFFCAYIFSPSCRTYVYRLVLGEGEFDDYFD